MTIASTAVAKLDRAEAAIQYSNYIVVHAVCILIYAVHYALIVIARAPPGAVGHSFTKFPFIHTTTQSLDAL